MRTTRDTYALQDILKDNQTFATVLLAIVLDEYGTEALEWEPEVTYQEIFEDFDVELPAVNQDKIQTIITALTTDQVQNDWLMFCHACNALNSVPIDFTSIDPPTPEEAAWAVTELAMVQDPEDSSNYSPEVKRFIGTVCHMNGLLLPPRVLSMADVPVKDSEAITSFGDDEAMLRGWYNKQRADADYVTEYASSKLMELITALDEVPLKERDSSAWGKFKENALKRLGQVS